MLLQWFQRLLLFRGLFAAFRCFLGAILVVIILLHFKHFNVHASNVGQTHKATRSGVHIPGFLGKCSPGIRGTSLGALGEVTGVKCKTIEMFDVRVSGFGAFVEATHLDPKPHPHVSLYCIVSSHRCSRRHSPTDQFHTSCRLILNNLQRASLVTSRSRG